MNASEISLEDLNRYYRGSIILVPHKRENKRMCPALVLDITGAETAPVFAVRRINSDVKDDFTNTNYAGEEVDLTTKPSLGWATVPEDPAPYWYCYRPVHTATKGIIPDKIFGGHRLSFDAPRLHQWYSVLFPKAIEGQIDKDLVIFTPKGSPSKNKERYVLYKGREIGRINGEKVVLNKHAEYLRGRIECSYTK